MPEHLPATTSRYPTPNDTSESEPSTEHGSRTGLVIAVYGARGVGVSAIAGSLARAFRSRERGEVALAEIDPRAARRRDHSRPADRDHMPMPDLDAAMVRQSDGVWTLVTVPPAPRPASDAKSVAAALDALRERFLVSVVELEHQVNERTLAAFDASDRLLLVTEGSVPSLRGTQRVLRLCRRLNYPDEKLCVVLNRVGAPGSLPAEDVSAALHRETYWRIQYGHLTTTGLAERLLSE